MKEENMKEPLTSATFFRWRVPSAVENVLLPKWTKVGPELSQFTPETLTEYDASDSTVTLTYAPSHARTATATAKTATSHAMLKTDAA